MLSAESLAALHDSNEGEENSNFFRPRLTPRPEPKIRPLEIKKPQEKQIVEVDCDGESTQLWKNWDFWKWRLAFACLLVFILIIVLRIVKSTLGNETDADQVIITPCSMPKIIAVSVQCGLLYLILPIVFAALSYVFGRPTGAPPQAALISPI